MHEHQLDDTIFALSSARGRAGISLHRISGGQCHQLLAPFLRAVTPDRDEGLSEGLRIQLKHARAKYCFIVDHKTELIDDCIVTFFEAPNSYTGEHTVEICAHGNPLISARLHSFLRNLGFRDARPGEFTQRAYLNGKIDLTRAEAIDQLIHAETQAGVTLARQASEGTIARVSLDIREQIMKALAYFEAHIDFGDDEVGTYAGQNQIEELKLIKKSLHELSESYSIGVKMREGIRVSFLGRPNAGKSSLYNALLGHERAIVTNIPGTTRDILEDRFSLDHRDFVLLDTAGLRISDNQVEQIGISRSLEAAKNSDIVLLIIDPTELLEHESSEKESLSKKVSELCQEILTQINKTNVQNFILVLTKNDCWPDAFAQSLKGITTFLDPQINATVTVSAHSHGLDQLFDILKETYDKIIDSQGTCNSAILISKRQQDKTLLAIRTLDEAINCAENNEYPEKIASLLISSAHQVREIVGDIGTDDILEKIFSNFCIGK
jgi:tRNA modification GTPase